MGRGEKAGRRERQVFLYLFMAMASGHNRRGTWGIERGQLESLAGTGFRDWRHCVVVATPNVVSNLDRGARKQ